MRKNSTGQREVPALLVALADILAAHRAAFRQERTYRRGVALVFGALFSFARHTVTQALLALGLSDADWSPFYRLFSRVRYAEEQLSRLFFRLTLAYSDMTQPYATVIDTTQIVRSSKTLPGTNWSRAPGTAFFRRGLQRAQRFLHGAWLPAIEEGYTRAIPLRFLPAFPEKAVPAAVAPCKEWEAGLTFVSWVRQELDGAGRRAQMLLVLGDGAYDVVGFWRGLPERTVALLRTAKNRRLRELPPAVQTGRGARRKYGAVAPAPKAWLKEREGWEKTRVGVRGRQLQMRYRVHGPYLREGAPGCPVFLVVVGGATWKAGRKEPQRPKYREPAFYLVSAVERDGVWQLPLPIDEILGWLWQRWEIEVAHREMKSGLGVGEMQCWNPLAAIRSVQWAVWVYAVLLLAGYRTWGLLNGPTRRERWWPGARRWSLNTLWRSYRTALWQTDEFRALWTGTGTNWLNKDVWLAGLSNAVAGAARS